MERAERLAEYRDKIANVILYLEKGTYPPSIRNTQKSCIRRRSRNYRKNTDGTLYCCHKTRWVQVVQTVEKVEEILKFYHESNGTHIGRLKMRERITLSYYWIGMSQDIIDYVTSCQSCRRTEFINRKPVTLEQIKVTEPLNVVEEDLINKDPSPDTLLYTQASTPTKTDKRTMVISGETQSAVIKLHKEGLTNIEIVHQLGISHAVVHDVVKHYESTEAVENVQRTDQQQLTTQDKNGIITQTVEDNLLTTPDEYNLPLSLETIQSEMNDNDTHSATNNTRTLRKSPRKNVKRKIEDVMDDESTCDSSTSSFRSEESDPLRQTTPTHIESLINNEDNENSYIKSDPLSSLVPVEQIYFKMEEEEEEQEGMKMEVMEEPLTDTYHSDDFMMSRKAKRNSRRRRKMNTFSHEEEENLAKWYKEHVILYDKEARDHKNRDKKKRLLQEKGKSMNPPVSGDQISTWIDTNRTRFGKLTTPKSGTSRPITSARDKWIIEKFSFLSGHIRRHSQQLGEQSFSPLTSSSGIYMQPELTVLTNTGTSSQYLQQETMEETECELIPEDDDGDSLLNTSVQTTPTTSTITINDTKTTTTTTGKRKQTTEDNELIDKITGQLSDMDVLTCLLKKLEKKSPREKTVHTFYEYVTNMTMDMDPELWREYTVKVIQLGNHYMLETEKKVMKKLYGKKL